MNTRDHCSADAARLADVWTYVQDLDPKENDVLLMGDFNRDKPTHPAFARLRALGVTNVIVGDGVFTTLSSAAGQVGSKWYDNIWIDRRYTAREFTGRACVDPVYLRYFQNSEHPHLEVKKRISDHCPVWAEFDVSKPDDD
jgi:endonuclease/exonuclease/phosphatase family metal-dependent hydrolase